MLQQKGGGGVVVFSGPGMCMQYPEGYLESQASPSQSRSDEEGEGKKGKKRKSVGMYVGLYVHTHLTRPDPRHPSKRPIAVANERSRPVAVPNERIRPKGTLTSHRT